MFDKARKYDVIVVGSGAGASIVDSALRQNMQVALVDRGPLGGTCLNVGCIPSKMIIFPADRVMEIQEAGKLGIEASIQRVDFAAIMERMRRVVSGDREHIRESIGQTRNLDFYEMEGRFIDGNTLQVGETRIRGNKIFLASGARSLIPPIEGIEEIDYLTNESALELTERPTSMVIIGGGYIGVEFGHFFSAMGTDVTIVGRNGRLVPEEEPEISDLLKGSMSERMPVHTRTEVIEARRDGNGYVVVGRDRHTGEVREFPTEQVLIAAGRKSNADLLQVEKAGIETGPRGYIRANEFLETNVPHIWAFGDAIGKHMFRHTANREAVHAWHNATHGEHGHKIPVDYRAIPHAVFSYPQIASVGLTEEQALGEYDILVGEARYLDVAKGIAMMETDGFAKAVIEKESGKILGFHIIGPYAPILIQEVVNAMALEGAVREATAGIHIHPALPELIVSTLYNLREPR